MFHWCVSSRKKFGSSHWEISVSCTSQEYNNVTTPSYPIFAIVCQVVTYRRLKTKKHFQLLAQKVVAVAYERWWLTRGSKYSDLTWKLLVFWKTGRLGDGWSLTRGGRNQRFNCISRTKKRYSKKEKRHSSLLWKTIQISSNYSLLHRHFNGCFPFNQNFLKFLNKMVWAEISWESCQKIWKFLNSWKLKRCYQWLLMKIKCEILLPSEATYQAHAGDNCIQTNRWAAHIVPFI